MWTVGFTKDIEVIAEWCYLIQLNPDETPTWYKYGFTEKLKSRFSSIRTVNPKCVLVGSWFAIKKWEYQSISDVSKELSIKKIGGEVYEIQDVALLSDI